MPASFFWHDYETFGANPRLDRPCQFAGIRTDEQLNPIGEAVEFWCRPTDDCLPHPEACLITGITPQQAAERGQPEPEFIAAILAELGSPSTCGVGYNSLRFDDEVTRHTAWRNFHDPYAREWRDGCSRWDIIDMVRLTRALRPDGIEWPLREDGQPSFRLEHLATANGLNQQRAHDALSDVHATIALARLIRDRQPRLYDYVLSHRDKDSTRALLGLRDPQPVLHVSEKFPASQGCLSMVLPITAHPVNSNGVLVYDLRHDPATVLDLAVEDLYERLFTPRAELPEDVERVAVKAVHINKCPVLVPCATMDSEQAARLDLDPAVCERHAQTLRRHLAEFGERLQRVFGMSEFADGQDPEQALYAGFIPNADQQSRDRVPRSKPEELGAIRFQDPRLNELLFRYRARHHPETLGEDETAQWREWVQRRLEFAPDGGLTLEQYFESLDGLRAQRSDDAAQTILVQLQDWGQQLQSRWM